MRIGFAKEQCFQFGVKELWRDSKGRGLSELVLTFHVESDVVGVFVVFGADLASVDALVGRLDVLYRQTPFHRSLVVVHSYPRIWSKLEETYRQRMNLVLLTPRHLHTTHENDDDVIIHSFIHSFRPFL